jgi:hypothetical protein
MVMWLDCSVNLISPAMVMWLDCSVNIISPADGDQATAAEINSKKNLSHSIKA